jgi:AraC-like DNA-binding protein
MQDNELDIQITGIHTIRQDILFPGKPFIQRPPRTFNTVVYYIQGSILFSANGQQIKLREGDFLFFRSGILDRSEAMDNKPIKYIYANFLTNNDDIFDNLPFLPILSLTNRSVFENSFHEIVSVWEGREVGCLLRVRKLLYHILSTMLDCLVQEQGQTKQYKKIKSAILYIRNHYKEDIQVDDLASLCRISPRHLIRCFQDLYGKPPHEFLIETRLQIAKELLQNASNNISEVADLTGYDSIYSFSRAFKHFYGVSPRDWRNT